MSYLFFIKFWYRKKCHESELKERTSFLFHHITTAKSCAMQTIRWYVATWDSPRGISTLQQQDAGIREIANEMNDFAHSKSRQNSSRKYTECGKLARTKWHEWEWLSVWMRKTMHSFISLLRFEFFERKNAHPYLLRNGDITLIFVIFCLIERFETIPSSCWKVSNVLSKEIFPYNIEHVFLFDSLIMYFIFFMKLWKKTFIYL